MKVMQWSEAVDKINDVLGFIHSSGCGKLYESKSLPVQVTEEVEFSKVPMLKKSDLVQHKNNLSFYDKSEVGYTASIFNEKDIDSLFLLPKQSDWSWKQLAEAINNEKPAAVIMLTPTFWQIAPHFYHTCREQKVPVSVVPPRSVHLAKLVIEEVDINFVVATKVSARELMLVMDGAKGNGAAYYWYLIASLDDETLFPDLPGKGTIEYHLFPGVPIAHAVFDGNTTDEEKFEIFPSSDYYFEMNDGKCLITSLNLDAVPLVRFEVPQIIDITADGKLLLS